MIGIDDATAVAGLKAAAPVVTNALSQVAQYISGASAAITDRVKRDLRVGYSDFLTASYERCQQVKTIVTGDHPVPLLEVYTNLHLTCAEKSYIDDALIESLEDFKRVVITGTGGAGKSMFMKYLTLARFEHTKGRIPLFVELRNLNNISSKDILPYCFATCSTAKLNVSYLNFEKVFSAGGLILILDGFDEIDDEYKELVEKNILELGRQYPQAIIVVSSRGDRRFKSWQNYYIFEVEKLNQGQVKSLINKVRYPTGIKKRFLRELPSLWETHQSFLSIPLLSVIMLLTFGKFSEISPKATLFYKLAFQTLFREHDANKEQFKRSMHTNLELDDFERSFAAFCALSYLDRKVSFASVKAAEYAVDAMKFSRLQFDAQKYIKDLIQNVCMLQEEGNELTFVHRSFQEYFTAVFLSGYHEQNQFEVINDVAKRESDRTLEMFKEIDEAKFEINWLIPTLTSLIDDLNDRLKSGSPSKALTWIFAGGMFDEDLRLSGLSLSDGTLIAILRQLERLYPKYEKNLSIGPIFTALRPNNIRDLFETTGAAKRVPVKRLLAEVSKAKPRIGVLSIQFDSQEDDWLKKTKVMSAMRSLLAGLKKLLAEKQVQREMQSSIILVR